MLTDKAHKNDTYTKQEFQIRQHSAGDETKQQIDEHRDGMHMPQSCRQRAARHADTVKTAGTEYHAAGSCDRFADRKRTKEKNDKAQCQQQNK